MKDLLALYGGEKSKKTPFGEGSRFGGEELKQLQEALNQNTLFYWSGKKVKEYTKKFANIYGVNYCLGTSSGSGAIHTALGALGITVGDEVITSPITDMGTIIGILLQNAIPVFADLHPYTYNLDPKSIEKRISRRTKAILVVHLAGNPADMDPIIELAKKYNLKIIEDCAQSYLSYYKGKLAGTFGDIGCFSTNDTKQISTGEGGILITNQKELFERASKFLDKNYNRLAKDTRDKLNISYVSPNYRMTELQGAVGIAQLGKLNFICSERNKYGEGLTDGIKDLKGIYIPLITQESKSSYWFYMLRINEDEAEVSRDEFMEALAAEGVPCQAGYTPECIYNHDLFLNKSAYQGTHCPFECQYYKGEVKYYKGLCPVAEEILATSIRIPVSEFYTEQDMLEVILAIKKISNYYRNRKNCKSMKER